MKPAAKLIPGPAQTVSEFGIGASEAAVAIGVSEYRRPIDAWLVKTGRRQPFEGNEKTFWGHALEPLIRAHYVEKHGVRVFVPPGSMHHRELPFVRATPDGIVLDDDGKWLFVGPQVKNIGWRMERAWEEASEQPGQKTAPIDYFVQGVVEMAVTDLPRIDFAVFCGGQNYFEVTLERDKGIEGDVLEGLTNFWRLVETNTQPELDDSASFRGHLLKQIKRKAHIAATPADISVLDRWRDIAVDMKRLKAEESKLKNQIASVLSANNAHRMTSDLGDITVGAPRKKTAWKAIAEQFAPLLSTFKMFERELAALHADAVDDPVLQRVEGLRAQLRLVGTLTNYEDVIARHTTHGDPTINRPRSWTKEVNDDSEDGES